MLGREGGLALGRSPEMGEAMYLSSRFSQGWWFQTYQMLQIWGSGRVRPSTQEE